MNNINEWNIKIIVHTLHFSILVYKKKKKKTANRFNWIYGEETLSKITIHLNNNNNRKHGNSIAKSTFHERHFDAIGAHCVSANVETEHEVRVSKLGAHASDARQLLHDGMRPLEENVYEISVLNIVRLPREKIRIGRQNLIQRRYHEHRLPRTKQQTRGSTKWLTDGGNPVCDNVDTACMYDTTTV